MSGKKKNTKKHSQGKFIQELKALKEGKSRPKAHENQKFEYEKRLVEKKKETPDSRRRLAVAKDIKGAREEVEEGMKGLKKW